MGAALVDTHEMAPPRAQSPIHQLSCLPEGKTLHTTPPRESLTRLLGASQTLPSGGLFPGGVLASPGLGPSRQGVRGPRAAAAQSQFCLYVTRRRVALQPQCCVDILTTDYSSENTQAFWF